MGGVVCGETPATSPAVWGVNNLGLADQLRKVLITYPESGGQGDGWNFE